jgi:hypothetical protein
MDKKNLKNFEVVGKAMDGSDVYWVESKGGYHQMLKKRKKDFQILGSGNHRAVARVLASQFEKNIQWAETLFKAENAEALQKTEIHAKLIPESNPSNHIAQAVWFTHQTLSNSTKLDKVYSTLNAVTHFMAAGLTKQQSLTKLNETLKKLNKNMAMEMPFDNDLLKISYEKTTKKPFPEAGE